MRHMVLHVITQHAVNAGAYHALCDSLESAHMPIHEADRLMLASVC